MNPLYCGLCHDIVVCKYCRVVILRYPEEGGWYTLVYFIGDWGY
jgi:hypothetical protein